jgi:MraZ protein
VAKSGHQWSRAVLRGSHQARIDEKGRLKVPTPFRAQIDATFQSASVFLTCDDAHGQYVRIYPLPVWEGIEQKLLKMPSTDIARRRYQRWTSLYGQEGELDAQNRVLIPPQLREPALMQGDVVVTGHGDFLEVWNLDRVKKLADEEKLTVENHNRLSEFGI